MKEKYWIVLAIVILVALVASFVGNVFFLQKISSQKNVQEATGPISNVTPKETPEPKEVLPEMLEQKNSSSLTQEEACNLTSRQWDSLEQWDLLDKMNLISLSQNLVFSAKKDTVAEDIIKQRIQGARQIEVAAFNATFGQLIYSVNGQICDLKGKEFSYASQNAGPKAYMLIVEDPKKSSGSIRIIIFKKGDDILMAGWLEKLASASFVSVSGGSDEGSSGDSSSGGGSSSSGGGGGPVGGVGA